MLLFLGLLVIGTVCATPVTHDPMINPGMFEGDMLGVELDTNRNAIPRDSQRWPNGVVPYVIESSLGTEVVDMLKKAFREIETATCVRFVERSNQNDYIRMFHGNGCFAHWGRIGGVQQLSLGNGCDYHGTVVHEILHAIGFEHEHNRSDRDEYLKINWENIEQAWWYAFKKLQPNENRLFTDFDFDSIMLYGQGSFAKAWGLKSMEAWDGRFLEEVYNKKGMSSSDITRIRLLYKC